MAPILKDMPYWLHVTGDLYVAFPPLPIEFSKVSSFIQGCTMSYSPHVAGDLYVVVFCAAKGMKADHSCLLPRSAL
jgi:hypothetical protein